MQTLQLNFVSLAALSAFVASNQSIPGLVDGASGNAPQPSAAPAATPAASTPSVAAVTAPAVDVFAPPPPPAAASGSLDFDRDVVQGALKPLSTKAGYNADGKVGGTPGFAGLMAMLKVATVAELKGKPETWPNIVAHAKAQGV